MTARDGAAVCELLPPKLKGGLSDEECAAGWEKELAQEPKPDYFGKVQKVERDGDSARAYFSGGGFLDLFRRGNEWYVQLIR